MSDTTHEIRNPALEARIVDDRADARAFLEVLARLERKVDRQTRQIEAQTERINEIEKNLAVGAEKMSGQGKNAERIDSLEQFRAEVGVKLGIIWAGLGISGTIAVSAAVTALIMLMGKGA